MSQDLPKVLILSRGVWDDTKGTSSTLTNLFEDYDSDKLAHLYIETIAPNTKCCHRFFQISEFSLIHKFYKWRTKTGHAFDTQSQTQAVTDDKVAEQELSTMQYVRGHRSIWFSFAREILWGLNGWKSKELKQFVMDFNPDVIWMDGSPLPLMNRLYNYVLKIAKKPAVIFMQDDVYTYESCGKSLLEIIRKHHLRKTVKRVVKQCDDMFVASPKMKKEYDAIFGFDSTFLAKSVKLDKLPQIHREVHTPIRLVYLGQVIYGRIYSLISIAEALRKINADGIKMQLFVYTNNQLSDEEKKRLLVKDSVFLMPPVPYSEVPRVMAENDVVVFVESFEPAFCKVARLSFSTKICDYLSSGNCVFAVGPADIAPMEYFKNEDAAIVANSREEIERKLLRFLDQQVVVHYIEESRKCVLNNHDRKKMDAKVYGKLIELAKTNTTIK